VARAKGASGRLDKGQVRERLRPAPRWSWYHL